MIVADTSAWIDYVRGVEAPHTDIFDYELQNNRIITGDLIITEFLQGFREENIATFCIKNGYELIHNDHVHLLRMLVDKIS